MNADNEAKTIRAITICEPWAWAVIHGAKRFENRSWYSDYQGPLVIHAGKSTKWMKEGCALLRKLGIEPPADLVFGAILGVVDMVDCVRPAQAKTADGKPDPFAFEHSPWCHQYANPRPLAKPIPYLGKLQFFRVARSLVAELLDGPGVAPATNETREERIERAIEAVGPTRVKRARQTDIGF